MRLSWECQLAFLWCATSVDCSLKLTVTWQRFLALLNINTGDPVSTAILSHCNSVPVILLLPGDSMHVESQCVWSFVKRVTSPAALASSQSSKLASGGDGKEFAAQSSWEVAASWSVTAILVLCKGILAQLAQLGLTRESSHSSWTSIV